MKNDSTFLKGITLLDKYSRDFEKVGSTNKGIDFTQPQGMKKDVSV